MIVDIAKLNDLLLLMKAELYYEKGFRSYSLKNLSHKHFLTRSDFIEEKNPVYLENIIAFLCPKDLLSSIFSSKNSWKLIPLCEIEKKNLFYGNRTLILGIQKDCQLFAFFFFKIKVS